MDIYTGGRYHAPDSHPLFHKAAHWDHLGQGTHAMLHNQGMVLGEDNEKMSNRGSLLHQTPGCRLWRGCTCIFNVLRKVEIAPEQQGSKAPLAGCERHGLPSRPAKTSASQDAEMLNLRQLHQTLKSVTHDFEVLGTPLFQA